jgi:predicted nucleotidyltransferase
MKFGLEQATIDKINSVFEKHPEVEEVIIYGSRAKDTHREGSDIDLCLKGTELTDRIISVIEVEIDELNTPYLFDFSIFDKLTSIELKNSIKKNGKDFYIKEN